MGQEKGAEEEKTNGAGAMLLKSVSIFLMTGRKASVNPKRPSSVSGRPSRSGSESRRRRKMQDPSGCRRSTSTLRLIEGLKRKTRFSWQELDNLCKLYKKLTSNASQQQVGQSIGLGKRPQSKHPVEGIDRAAFRDFLHSSFSILAEDMLIERMFCCWDRENEGVIRVESWVTSLDVFLRGSLRDKIEYCFRVYDLNNDGFIAKEEIFQLFKNCLIKQQGEEDPDEGVRDLSELALKKIDVDRDGKISFLDYKAAVKDEPLLLEAFGQCLPTDDKCTDFLTSLQSSS